SPFIPIDILNSNLPVAVFEWELTNPGKKPVSYSLALTMQNPLGMRGQNGRFTLNEFTLTPNTVSGWKGFTFSNYISNSLIPGTGAVRGMSSSENAFYVPLIGDRQKALEQFWSDFSTDGKLESRGDAAGSSGRLESRGNSDRSSAGLESRDTASSSDERESWGDTVRYSGEERSMAALYSTGVLDPGESVTIPFLFSWYVPFGDTVERLLADDSKKGATNKKTSIPFEDKTLGSGAENMPSASRSEDRLSAICLEDKASRSESKSLASRFKSIDDITGYMVSGYKNLRDKTMQFSHSMITSTISPEALDTVLSGFADTVEQRAKNMEVISNPFPDRGTIGDSGDLVDDKSAWDNYYAPSGFAYDEKERIMKFSPAIDVLPVRFFWATQSGWGTINVSRARIVLDCIYGSLDLQQLFLEGRSFFVFREFVPSQNAVISYDNETLRINFTEKLNIMEGELFVMEIP
ncbi:MAG: hypothetical protein LC655_00575, partial [Bacteroidales bacterium]|nr:hypothetical protein [Bacteroidales bacterium]